MPDIIRLLPDSIANQIAAGEVIQRPASVVKELMENALDAGADTIQVIVKDAGKVLIQVVDNGMGMSETDARMAFERHATSKIRKADDLFAIRSMGFRGEALASIAAVAQVELKTRQGDDTIGTRIVVEGTEIRTHEPTQAGEGTTLAVKNLFYNIPARRKFLKADPVEFRHLMDEFTRIALAHPEIAFSLFHNDSEVYILHKGKLRQRIVGLLGKRYNEHLVPVDEETNYVTISGFAGKPDMAKRKRGDQYLFVNRRFIRSPYLHHAVRTAYEEMIPEDHHPMYVLFLDVDPARIDVNVHPAKQEIKFEDERLIYNFLRVSIRHALGKYSVTPSLDFDVEQRAFTQSGDFTRPAAGGGEESRAAIQSDNRENWQRLFDQLSTTDTPKGVPQSQRDLLTPDIESDSEGRTYSAPVTHGDAIPFHLHRSLLIAQTPQGMILVDQQAAHERILFERYLSISRDGTPAVQKLIFPETLELNGADAALFREILGEVCAIGFDVEEFGGNSFIVHGVPALAGGQNAVFMLEKLLEQYRSDVALSAGVREKIARAMSLSSARQRGTAVEATERKHLLEELFACENPYTSPSGRKCFITFELEELFRRFIKFKSDTGTQPG